MTKQHRKKVRIFSPFHAFTISNRLLLRASLCLYAFLSFIGCYKPPAPITNLQDAQLKLEQLLIDDFSIHPVITPITNTLVIYIPVDFDLLKTQAARTQKETISGSSQKRQINFLDAAFNELRITINYDIAVVNSYPKPLGYTSAYTDDFSRIHNGILSAISRSYSDFEVDQNPPDFVKMLIVDTKNGIGIKNVFHLKDLLNVMTGALPQEEYIKRYITEMFGDVNLISNKTGRGLHLQNITWPEFIAKQITYRINFKYTRSSFPPAGSDADEIMAIINDTIIAYDFDDFETIELKDLASGETFLFNKEQLKTFKKN
jgi:hypothetical protein